MTFINILEKLKSLGSSLWPYICLLLTVVLAYQSFSTNKLVVHTIHLQDSLGSIQNALNTTHNELKLRDSTLKLALDSLKKQNTVITSKSKDIDRLKGELLSKPHDPKIDTLIAAYDTVVNVYQQQLLATARLAAAALENSAAKDTIIDEQKRINKSLNDELDKWTKKNTQKFSWPSAGVGYVIGTVLTTTALLIASSR